MEIGAAARQVGVGSLVADDEDRNVAVFAGPKEIGHAVDQYSFADARAVHLSLELLPFEVGMVAADVIANRFLAALGVAGNELAFEGQPK